MSEVQKPVEELPALVVEATPAAEPVAEAAVIDAAPVATEAETVDAPVAVAEPATEEETPKKEFEGEGVLGYKAPGGFIKKLAGFQKKFFWFGTDAVEIKSLTSYLRGEKPEVGNHNAAWSSQTGQGLLYFSKQAGDKATPAGLINLADITDIKEDGTVDFIIVSHGQKHIFQTTSLVDRDNWVVALKAKSAEAKESVESITGSDGYKEQLSSLSKPAAVVAPVVAKVEEKKEEKAAVEDKKEEKAAVEDKKVETKEEKKARTKSRSASRKRNSIFGGFGLGGKKEDAAEKAEAKEDAKVDAAPVEAAVIPTEAPVEVAEVAEPVVEEPVATETAAAEPRPAASKRHSSLFDFKSRFGSKKAPAEAAPVVPAKDEEVVTSTEAPVIPAVEQSEPLAASIASPATSPTEAVTNGESATEVAETKAETKPEVRSDRRKSSLPFGLGQKKEKTPEVEGEKTLSPFAKLRQTVKHKTSTKAAEKAPEKTEDKTEDKPAEPEAPTAEAEATEELVTAAPVVQASTPVVSATA